MVVSTAQAQLFLQTADGLLRFDATHGPDRLDALGADLDGENIRAVCQDAGDPRRLYAASVQEVYSSQDGGDTWRQLPAGGLDRREIWTMAAHPSRPGEVYVGTLPAAVYVSRNGGLSFEELSSFRMLPDYSRWTFPPPPHDSHIRSFALDARVPDEIVVGVEEGGVARSRDAGTTWEDISGVPSDTALPQFNDPTGQLPYEAGDREDGHVYRDVHMVLRHPGRLNTLYASTGLGTYRTDDAGATWDWMGNGMPLRYSVPMAVHPDHPDRVFLGAAEYSPPMWKGYRTARTGPFNVSKFAPDLSEKFGGAKCTLFRSDDAGDSWRVLDNGVPTGNAAMCCAIRVHPENADEVYAAFTDGAVYASSDAGASWRLLSASHPKLYGLQVFKVG